MKSLFVESLEKNGEVFSVIKVELPKKDIKKYFDSKKVELVFSVQKSDSSGKISWEEIVYKTPQGFYVQCNQEFGDETTHTITIYYKSSQSNELKFYLNQLYKN